MKVRQKGVEPRVRRSLSYARDVTVCFPDHFSFRNTGYHDTIDSATTKRSIPSRPVKSTSNPTDLDFKLFGGILDIHYNTHDQTGSLQDQPTEKWNHDQQIRPDPRTSHFSFLFHFQHPSSTRTLRRRRHMPARHNRHWQNCHVPMPFWGISYRIIDIDVS